MHFLFSKDMSTDQILEQTRGNLWKYFAYRPTEKKKGKLFSAEGIRSISVFWKSKCYFMYVPEIMMTEIHF